MPQKVHLIFPIQMPSSNVKPVSLDDHFLAAVAVSVLQRMSGNISQIHVFEPGFFCHFVVRFQSLYRRDREIPSFCNRDESAESGWASWAPGYRKPSETISAHASRSSPTCGTTRSVISTWIFVFSLISFSESKIGCGPGTPMYFLTNRVPRFP